ncbi:MAG: PP2C family protein-serine/threonine phosphatase [Pirellulaceae bacterium]|nr:PP2C family protein-serine/threonine phosphatase [Pirellulaceae bacterium]
MPFQTVLALAIVAQVIATLLAVRLHWRYRWRSAWAFLSASSLLIAVQHAALLMMFRADLGDAFDSYSLWTVCLSALAVSVLFLGGVALIEPFFRQLARAEALLKREKRILENEVEKHEYELQVARQIQQSLLPDEVPRLAGIDVAGTLCPAAWASGDHYDFMRLADGSVLVLIADVTGHGTGPALLMASTRAFFRALAQTCGDVGVLLTQVNRLVADDVKRGRFVTAFVVAIDPHSRTLTYCGAGHQVYLVQPDGSRLPLDATGPPLGIVPDFVHEPAPPIAVEPGQILALLTDGIPEAVSPSDEAFGWARVCDYLHQHADLPAAQILAGLLRESREFVGPQVPQRDDMTAVIIRIHSDAESLATSPSPAATQPALCTAAALPR